MSMTRAVAINMNPVLPVPNSIPTSRLVRTVSMGYEESKIVRKLSWGRIGGVYFESRYSAANEHSRSAASSKSSAPLSALAGADPPITPDGDSSSRGVWTYPPTWLTNFGFDEPKCATRGP